ncbi:MAG: phosphotransferase family protein [Beutenbergiaceae bacterium]
MTAEQQVRELLARLDTPMVNPSLSRLTGGVSSDIWLVQDGQRRVVVKRPLAQLRVAASWSVPTTRGDCEAAWLRFVATVVPGACPQLVAFDAATHSLVLEYLDPTGHSNWKVELMAGRVDAWFAAQVGATLGEIHAASVRAQVADQFRNQCLFEALRIEPYLRRTAAQYGQLRPQFHQLITALETTQVALVHGDVSPKNILTGQSPILLDAECATWGDPAFDLAFCQTHLILKQVHLPRYAEAIGQARQALLRGYLDQVDWEEPAAVSARAARLVPALALARVAGASPAEYLSAQEGQRVEEIALLAMQHHDIDSAIAQTSGHLDAGTTGGPAHD